jgi:branched-subunit amino acid transport protein
MNDALMIFGMFLVTFGVRYPPLAIVGKLDLPENVIRALRYVPVAVLTAITVPAILMPQGSIDVGLSNAYFYAGIFAIVVSWRTKNLLFTIVLGMLFFFIWRLVL